MGEINGMLAGLIQFIVPFAPWKNQPIAGKGNLVRIQLRIALLLAVGLGLDDKQASGADHDMVNIVRLFWVAGRQVVKDMESLRLQPVQDFPHDALAKQTQATVTDLGKGKREPENLKN